MRVRLGAMDLITLDIQGTVVERLDAPDADPVTAEDAPEDDEETAGPIAIAVDIDEAPPGDAS